MKVIAKDVTFPFDVDATLVFWIPIGKEPPPEALAVEYYGETVYVVPHEEHVRLLKSSLARGRNIVVWSGNGFQWAENVLKALGFGDADNILVMSKPAGYVDDLPCTEWMGNRVYIKPHSNPWSEE